jgi:hypothetical protein
VAYYFCFTTDEWGDVMLPSELLWMPFLFQECNPVVL